MNVKVLTQGAETTYAVVFETGDEVMAGLTAFARERRLDAGRLTAIGGFSAATLGFFDVERKEFRKIPIAEQVEVLSLVGDITLDDGKPMVHAHVVVGTADGMARGGHILEAHVRPTLEVIVVESPNSLHRAYDPATGLALIEL